MKRWLHEVVSATTGIAVLILFYVWERSEGDLIKLAYLSTLLSACFYAKAKRPTMRQDLWVKVSLAVLVEVWFIAIVAPNSRFYIPGMIAAFVLYIMFSTLPIHFVYGRIWGKKFKLESNDPKAT